MNFPKKHYLIMGLILISSFIPLFGHSIVFVIISRLLMLAGLTMAFFDKKYRERLSIPLPDWVFYFLFVSLLIITFYQCNYVFAEKLFGRKLLGTLAFVCILIAPFYAFKRLVQVYPEKRRLLIPVLSIVFFILVVFMFKFVSHLFIV